MEAKQNRNIHIGKQSTYTKTLACSRPCVMLHNYTTYNNVNYVLSIDTFSDDAKYIFKMFQHVQVKHRAIIERHLCLKPHEVLPRK